MEISPCSFVISLCSLVSLASFAVVSAFDVSKAEVEELGIGKKATLSLGL
jgi:hypothetical protein